MTALSTVTPLDVAMMTHADKPTSSVIVVDPATAERWLKRNKINRSLRERTVNAYARDMTAGRWRLTGSPIQFDRDGNMIDGQHRCAAIVRSGRAVPLFVVRGLDSDAQRVIDTGTKRTVADALHFSGYNRGPLLAASVKLAALVEDGRIYQDTMKQSVSAEETIDWLDAHPDFPATVALVDSLRHRIDAPPSILVVSYWLTSRVDAKAAASFFDGLANRTGLPEGSPILAIDSRLREMRRNRVSMQSNRRDLLSMFIRGWNAWRKCQTMRTIPLASRDGRIREPL